MNVTELIAAVGGDGNIGIQPLDAHAIALDWNAKTGTKITFRSDVLVTPEGTEKLGLVVWFPREAVAAALAKSRAANGDAPNPGPGSHTIDGGR